MPVLRLAARLALGRRLPRAAGDLSVPQLRAKVAVHRDRWGVPVVEASDPLDGWYGLGFCHGQDRAGQLEMLLRLSRGALAELVGPAGLPTDRLVRRLGLGRAAEAQLPLLRPEHRAILEAYTAGINAGHSLGLPRRPHELALLGVGPTPWVAADVLALTKLQSFLLASNWDCELARLRLLTDAGPDAVAALDPAYPAGLPTITPPGATAGRVLEALAGDLAALSAFAPPGGGSNNWAIAPSRTATGRALVAGDPHLAPLLPNHFYLARIRTPEWSIAGGSFVGTPTFACGHNGHLAWALTAGLTDNTDLFLERLSADGATYEQDGRRVPCATREEVILVRGSEPATEVVRETARGPILSPALDGVPEAVSIRATWLEPLPVVGWLAAQEATGRDAFRAAFADWPLLAQSVVFADATGGIGYQLTGRLPVRKRGTGAVPLPGWDGANGWEADPVPFADMPRADDPAQGFLCSANNAPAPLGDKPFLGRDFRDGYRAARIADALASRADWNREACLALQLDRRSLVWEEVRSSILETTPEGDPDAFAGLELLRDFDGVLRDGSAGAAVFELLMAALAKRVAEAKAPGAGDWALGRGYGGLADAGSFAHRRQGHLSRLLREQPPGWFEDGWPRTLSDTLAGVIRHLRATRGPGPRWWGWGDLRPLVGRHALLGETRAWKAVFNRGPFPFGGDDNTVCQASVAHPDPLAPTTNVPCLRAVMDVGNWGDSRFVLFGGQSGNPLSPHYDDLIPAFLAGEGVPIPWTDEEIRAATRQTLWLRPAGA